MEKRRRHKLRKREQIRQGREEEMNDKMKTLGMFEFGSWLEATSRAGKAPTTTTWTRGSEGRLVRTDATTGGNESIVCIRCRGAREETGPGGSEAHTCSSTRRNRTSTRSVMRENVSNSRRLGRLPS